MANSSHSHLSTYNQKAEEGNKFTLSLGTGVVKVTNFGNSPVKLGLQYSYYATSPGNFGPKHQTRFQIVPVNQSLGNSNYKY